MPDVAAAAYNLPPAPLLEAARMRPRRRRGQGQRLTVFIALCLIGAGFILPLVWMLSTSLKTTQALGDFPPKFIPPSVELHHTAAGTVTPLPENYWKVINHDKIDFPLYTRNTLTVALLAVAGTVLSSSLVAYGFARVRFKGRGFLFALMLSTMMVPFPVLMVSLFSIFRFIGDHTPLQMLGTLRPLWLPAWFGSSFNIFLLRQFYLTIPEELSEAARIDGCTELGIWWRVILPLSRPALTVVALFTFLGSWNDFLGPLIYLQDPQQYTLALGLQVFQNTHGGTDWNLLMAASLMILMPVLVLYFVAQKTFVEGIATSGLKG